MRRLTFPSASATSASGAVRRRSPAIASPWTVNQRLANAERELRIPPGLVISPMRSASRS